MWSKQATLVVLAVASLYGQSPTPTPDARQAVIERLDNLAKDEKDPERQRKLWQEMWNLRQQQYQDNIPRFHEEWCKESDPEKKREIGEELVDAAIKIDQPQYVLEVATGGTLAEKEIKVPGGPVAALPLRTLLPFDPEPYPYEQQAAWVIRRMTRDRFELWLPNHGWLFSSQGKVVNEARPPRRDGYGRQWYGAFLPDGHWVTTDIWEYDRTLHFFSRAGKWRKDLAADELVPRGSGEDRGNASIIGWCRCDKEGRGFVLSVGTNGGRGAARVTGDGQKHRVLAESESPWKICYPRDLEPKGMYTALSIPNDQGDQTIGYTVPGHGAECGYPTYRWSEISVQVLGPGAFGFWPDSSNVYIQTALVDPSKQPAPDTSGEESTGPPITLFYNFDGTFTGWIKGTRISDATQRGGMLFHDELDRVITLTPDLRVTKIERFVHRDGTAASPEKLFPDLRLGFFKWGKKLVLAGW
ncbi:MAG: hypothetical protein QOE34_2928 [Verrucomicrobiota bacterium]|jgi:hypothetical protein